MYDYKQIFSKASFMRNIIGDDLSATQRNSITMTTIEKYAKAASSICLVRFFNFPTMLVNNIQLNAVVILVKMPLELFMILSRMIRKFNEGLIKVLITID